MRIPAYLIVALFVAIPLCSPPAGAAEYRVYAGGYGDFATIQQAVGACVSGDTISLGEGVFTGDGNRDIDTGGLDILIRSTSGAAACTIDCGGGAEGEHRGFYIHNGETRAMVIEGITITGGYLVDESGGGIWVAGGSAPTIEDCVVTGNEAVDTGLPGVASGAGILIQNSSPAIAGCEVSGNTAGNYGGGIYISGSSSNVEISGCDITGNEAAYGGGIFSSSAAPVIAGCLVEGNTATSSLGGGIHISGQPAGTPPRISICIVAQNTAANGGGLYAAACEPVVSSCTFTGNSSYGFYGDGGTVTDCIFYQNGATEIVAPGAEVTYCWVEGGYAGAGNIAGTSIAFQQGPAGDYYLPPGTECENAGSAPASSISFASAGDLYGLDGMTVFALQDFDTGQVDIGCHRVRLSWEYEIPGDLPTIQAGIDHAVEGDTIALAWQTFYEDIDFKGKDILVWGPGHHNWPPEVPTIEGSGSGPVVTMHNGESAGAELRGVYVRNGSGTYGGGVSIRDSSPTLDDVRIYGCTATYGGGLYVSGGSPALRHLSITDNSAQFGGGAYLTYCSPAYFSTSRVGRNTSTFPSGGKGGGIYINESSFYLYNTALYGNSSQDGTGTGSGGALYVRGSSSAVQMSDLCLADNGASEGSALTVENGEVTVESSIIALSRGGEPVTCAGGTFAVSCSDIYGNEAGDFSGCLAGLEQEEWIYSVDPVFCDPENDDYGISDASPMYSISGCGGRIGTGSLMSCLSDVVSVNAAGTGDFPTIQAAVDANQGGDVVELEDGTYTGAGNRDVDFGGKSITIRSRSGDSDSCEIDCGGTSGDPHRGFILDDREGSSARIENLTIRNAYTGGGGGGIRIWKSSPTVSGCRFVNCIAFDGGGIQTYMSRSLIEGCDFVTGYAEDAGGGIMNHTSDPVIRDCTFQICGAEWGGGALYNHYSSPRVERCVFARNTSNHWGGAVHNNHAESSPEIRSCTFSANQAPLGGHLYSRNDAAPVLSNSILAFSLEGSAAYAATGATTSLSCCDVYGNTGGDYVDALAGQEGVDGNFSADPLFCGYLIDYLRLQESSPCAQGNSGGCGLIGAIWEGCHSTTGDEDEGRAPRATRLIACYPNPFNPSTSIYFELSEPGEVSLRIYDAAGRLVRTLVDGRRKAGRYEEAWNGTGDGGRPVASGVYFCRLTAPGFESSRKLVLLR